MKRIIVTVLILLSLFGCLPVFANQPAYYDNGMTEVAAPESYEGYWLEKAEDPLLICITPAAESDWFEVTITRQEKRSLMDLYRMRAHYQKDGSLYYENGLYVIRKTRKNGKFKDKEKYSRGSGLFYYSFDENVLYWSDYTIKPEKNVRTFTKTASPVTDETM